MHSSLRVGLMLGFSLSAVADVVGSWTLSGLSRNCVNAEPPLVDHSRCAYRFNISESGEPGDPGRQCTIWAYADDDKPAAEMSFEGLRCVEPDTAGVYKVSGGYARKDFIALAVLNRVVFATAYFGFAARQVDAPDGAPPLTEPAFKVGKPDPSLDPEQIPAAMGGDGEPLGADGEPLGPEHGWARSDAPCDPDVWVVRNLSRNARPVMQIVLFRFDLDRCNGTIRCSFEAQGNNPRTVPIEHDGFSDARCTDAPDVRVSWGYKPDTDGGIMTIDDVRLRRRAYFGWDNVNSRVKIDEAATGVAYPY